MSKGITITEECHVLNLLPPIDTDGTAREGYFSMGNYAHATIVVASGVIGNTATVTVFESDDTSGGNEAAIDFKRSADGGALAWIGNASGFATGTDDNQFSVIEIDASQLASNRPCVGVKITNAAAHLVTFIVILSGSRYAQAVTSA